MWSSQTTRSYEFKISLGSSSVDFILFLNRYLAFQYFYDDDDEIILLLNENLLVLFISLTTKPRPSSSADAAIAVMYQSRQWAPSVHYSRVYVRYCPSCITGLDCLLSRLSIKTRLKTYNHSLSVCYSSNKDFQVSFYLSYTCVNCLFRRNKVPNR